MIPLPSHRGTLLGIGQLCWENLRGSMLDTKPEYSSTGELTPLNLLRRQKVDSSQKIYPKTLPMGVLCWPIPKFSMATCCLDPSQNQVLIFEKKLVASSFPLTWFYKYVSAHFKKTTHSRIHRVSANNSEGKLYAKAKRMNELKNDSVTMRKSGQVLEKGRSLWTIK